MKSHEFITEDNFDPYVIHDLMEPDPDYSAPITKVEDPDKIADIIRDNCSVMLQAYQQTGKVLYRGLTSTKNVVITGIRPDRRPVQMDYDYHKTLHQLFLDAGLTATRTNSIFCSARISIANIWGSTVYAIFVKDGWTGTIFSKIKDNYAYYAVRDIASRENPGQRMKEFKNLGPTSFNTSVDLAQILNKRYTDILITGSSYIGVSVESSFFKRILNRLNIRLI
jgi:hypothetical protein